MSKRVRKGGLLGGPRDLAYLTGLYVRVKTANYKIFFYPFHFIVTFTVNNATRSDNSSLSYSTVPVGRKLASGKFRDSQQES